MNRNDRKKKQHRKNVLASYANHKFKQAIKEERDTEQYIKSEQDAEENASEVNGLETDVKQEIKDDPEGIPETWAQIQISAIKKEVEVSEEKEVANPLTSNKQYTPQCPGCNEKFLKDVELLEHYKKNESHKPKRFQCFTCCKSFDIVSDLRVHQATHEEQKYKKKVQYSIHKLHECVICGQGFHLAESLRTHYVVHIGPRYGCEKCDKVFVSSKAVLSHYITDHGRLRNERNQFECTLCRERFLTQYGIEKHIASHNLQHRFVCNLCGQRFAAKPLLETHAVSHQGQDLYECHLCGKRFSGKVMLDSHLCIAANISSLANFESYLEREMARYTEDEFRQHFRMKRTTFQHILALIGNKIGVKKHCLSERAQLQLALWYFGRPEYFRSLDNQIKITNRTALSSIKGVTQALFKLAPSIISWPSGEDFDNVRKGFNELGLPGAIGILGSTHIRTLQSIRKGEEYIFKESFSNVILQAVCDHNLKFTHCYLREEGLGQNATVLQKSELWKFMNKDSEAKFPDDTHIIGDKTYPCLLQLITPYEAIGNLSAEERQFNNLLSLKGNGIANAFNLLQERFRCLKGILDLKNTTWARKYIIACCVLHNICIMLDDVMEIDGSLYWHNSSYEVEADTKNINGLLLTLGVQKRDEMCTKLFNNSCKQILNC